MENTIQFYHNQAQDVTYAVNVNFDRDDLLESIHHFDSPIELSIGISYVHPNDKYCKKTGREVSSQKLLPVLVKLSSIHTDESRLYLNYKTDDGMYIKFRVNKKSEKPHLLSIYS